MLPLQVENQNHENILSDLFFSQEGVNEETQELICSLFHTPTTCSRA